MCDSHRYVYLEEVLETLTFVYLTNNLGIVVSSTSSFGILDAG